LKSARSVSMRYFQVEIENHTQRDEILRIATLVVDEEIKRRARSRLQEKDDIGTIEMKKERWESRV